MRIPYRAFLLISLCLAVTLPAQTPKPAASGTPKPAGAAPRPAASPAAAKTEAPPPAPKPAVRASRPADAPVSYSLGLSDVLPPPVKLPDAASETLGNGMKLVVARNAALPVVEVAMLLANGYSQDPPGKRGLNRAVAHSLRHGGTRDRGGKAVEEFLEERHLGLQVSVGPVLTEWTARCRKEDLPDLLQLMAEMLARPAFQRSAIDDITGQMRAAIQARPRNLDLTGIQEAEAAWFGEQSPWSRRFTYDDIRMIDRDAIQEQYAATVTPGRTWIGLSGDITLDEARRMAAATLGAWTAAASASPPAAPLPSAHGKLIAIDQPNALEARLLLALPWGRMGASRPPEDLAALGIFAALLQSQPGAELDTLMSRYLSGNDAPRLLTGLGPAELPVLQSAMPLRPREAVDATIALIKRVRQLAAEKPAPAALESAKRVFLRNLALDSGSPPARFRLLMRATALGIDPGYWSAVHAAAAAMAPAGYARRIEELVKPESAFYVLTGDERDYRSAPSAAGLPVARATLTPLAEPAYKADESEAGRARAAELLARARKAMGGQQRLDSLTDAVWDYRAVLTRSSPAIVIEQHNSWRKPVSYRQEQKASIGSGVSFFDGKLGWVHNGRNLNSLSPLVARQFRNEVIRLLFRLVRADHEEGYRVAYAGAGLVQITSSENYVVEMAFDFDTGLPERLRFLEQRPTDGAPIRVEEQFSDFRDVSGVLMPHRIAVKQNGREFAEFILQQMRFNTGLTEEEIGRRP